MRNQVYQICMVLIVGFLLVCSPVWACSGGNSGGNDGSNDGGGGNESLLETGSQQTTGIKSHGPVQGAYGIVMTPAQIKKKYLYINRMNRARNALRYFQTVEKIGDYTTFTTQYGLWAFSYKYVNKVIFWPVAAVWQVGKHSGRTAWGVYTGKLDSVYEANESSYPGQFVNWALIQRIK